MATEWVKTVDSDYFPEWSLIEDHDGRVARELVGTVYRGAGPSAWVVLDRAGEEAGSMDGEADAKALAESLYDDECEREYQRRAEKAGKS